MLTSAKNLRSPCRVLSGADRSVDQILHHSIASPIYFKFIANKRNTIYLVIDLQMANALAYIVQLNKLYWESGGEQLQPTTHKLIKV